MFGTLITTPCSRLPWWLRCKESACNVGNPGLTLRWSRSPGEENGNPLQYSLHGKSPGQRSLVGQKQVDMTERLSLSQQRAHLFCSFSEDSSLRLAQLLHHLVKQAVSILQQNKWFLMFFQSPWIQNLLISRNKPISAQGFSVTYYNSDSISKRGSTRRIERICLDGRTGWCLNGLIILFD